MQIYSTIQKKMVYWYSIDRQIENFNLYVYLESGNGNWFADP